MEWDLQAEVGLHHVPHLLCHVVVEVGTLQGNLALLAQLQGADRTWAQLLTALGQEPLVEPGMATEAAPGGLQWQPPAFRVPSLIMAACFFPSPQTS